MAPLTGIQRESISKRGEERRLTEEKIKLSPLKVCRRFHETGAIINMQWHMHTSKMIPDASSWIIKFPKVPFAHRILRAATTTLMNHSGSVEIYGKRVGGTEKRGNGSCVLLDCQTKIILVLSSLTPWQTAVALHPRVTGGPMNRLWGLHGLQEG